jgi:hypothetical protein
METVNVLVRNYLQKPTVYPLALHSFLNRQGDCSRRVTLDTVNPLLYASFSVLI